MQQTATTAEGRRITFVATPTEHGRVIYDVAKVGAFTIEPETYAYDTSDRPQQRVHLRYGRVDGPDPYSRDQDLPDQPVVCTVRLSGGAVFDAEKIHTRGRYWLAVHRRGGGSAPDGTARRTADIVRVLVADWLARDDHDELRGYHDWHLAPSRIANAQHTIDRLHQVIAPRLSELASE